MGDRATLDFYEREAPSYTLSGREGPARHLDNFLSRLAPGARILELGCGGGRDAAHMLKRGFDVVPTDGSAAMAKKGQERIGIAVQVMRFDELDAVEEYDAVWAHASIHHMPFDGLPDVLRRIARALKPGGWHYANFKLGEGEARDTFGRLYNFPPEEELRAAYAAIPDWDFVDVLRYEDGGLDKVMRDWMAITMHKKPA
ncbi:class I SAM-dependent methyltransferase [Alteraurantiacibacter aestuarii]|nr:class I SAM-dependent methyltransferase [Alteraurantiacibacter aestuarii]